MICNNNYLADIIRVCEIKDLIWVMRFQSPLVYNGIARTLKKYAHQRKTTGSSNDSLDLRPFSKWELLLKERIFS